MAEGMKGFFSPWTALNKAVAAKSVPAVHLLLDFRADPLRIDGLNWQMGVAWWIFRIPCVWGAFIGVAKRGKKGIRSIHFKEKGGFQDLVLNVHPQKLLSR